MAVPFEAVGWLNAASGHPEVLRVFIEAGASKNDQSDKDLALVGAARSGSVDAARELITYGANPNADLSEQIVTESGGGMTMQGNGAGRRRQRRPAIWSSLRLVAIRRKGTAYCQKKGFRKEAGPSFWSATSSVTSKGRGRGSNKGNYLLD